MKHTLTILIILTLFSCRNSYDKGVWLKNENQKPDNPRFDMVEDLKSNFLIKGISFDEVKGILGKAGTIDTNHLGIHWTYSIGSNPGMHIDPYYLVIEFDSSGQLTETRISEH